ncbi:MAG: SDR family oxidoreductase [Legionella sp.]|nr:MAG: SDR family oxidoreductase [Legionella sp.]
MHHLILGYGYSAYYLAQLLLEKGQTVTAVSRHLAEQQHLSLLDHRCFDLQEPFIWDQPNTIIYYFIPPSNSGERDSFLNNFLQNSQLKAHKIIYFSSSAVYGNQQGRWVNEETACEPHTERELRRLDAEQQWQDFCQKKSIPYCLLRVAGIYGPERLPIAAAQSQTPVILSSQAPYTNSIYVKDLAHIAYTLGTLEKTFNVYNVADGEPHPMGFIQQLVAQALHIPPAPEKSWDEVFAQSSPMKKEFMASSKRLSIQRLQNTLGQLVALSPLIETIKLEINQYHQRTTASD